MRRLAIVINIPHTDGFFKSTEKGVGEISQLVKFLHCKQENTSSDTILEPITQMTKTSMAGGQGFRTLALKRQRQVSPWGLSGLPSQYIRCDPDQ